MSPKSPTLPDHLHSYLLAHSTPPDQITAELISETHSALPEQARMQIAPEQAAFLTLITRLMGVREAVEVGTFTGLSSLSIARGLAAGGRLTCFDVSEDFTAVAKRYWQRAGVDDRIELRIGDARDGLRALPERPYLDLCFIDADKLSYPTYWAELVPRTRPGGLIVVDNVLQAGRVVDPAEQGEQVVAIREFNAMVAADERVEAVMLPIADGLTLARRRS